MTTEQAPDAARTAPWVWVVVVAALFTLVQLPYAPGNFYPDSTEYLTQVYGLLGDSREQGREKAIQAFCSQYRRPSLVIEVAGSDPAQRDRAGDSCVKRLHAQNGEGPGTRYGPAITRDRSIPSTRYEDIFLSRPAVSLFYLPAVVVAGPRAGMWATTLAWTLLAGVLAFLLLRRLGMPLPLALLGQVLLLILPMRNWMMAPLAEGMTITLMMACLLGAVYALTGNRGRGVALLATGLAVGTFVKYSQFLLFAVALAGVLGLVLLFARRRGERLPDGSGMVIAVALAAAAGMFLLSRGLGWPGGADTIQDLLTDHFRQPDVAEPVGTWLSVNGEFWQQWLAGQLQEPFQVVAWAAGVWGVLRLRTTAAFAVLAALPAGLANQFGHPNITQGDRIYTAAWLVVVYGIPMLLHTFTPRPAATDDTSSAILVPMPLQGGVPRQSRGVGHPDHDAGRIAAP
ncbi:hypothetical protein ACFQS1_15970 [Paractinoplanes rhizophilus]|uniref:Glycosyltransferase RgtA/B/C/D-like domain-containing protein n=1 Tax=Paractinoplanes rhizophilus TaxID=1416877 RepID=A0ABW2HQJ6_9ACTN